MFRAVRKRFARRALGGLLVAFLGLNALAWFHAGAMTTWRAGSRTDEPEQLGLLERLSVLAKGVRIPRPVDGWAPDQLGLPVEVVHLPGGLGAELEAWFVPSARPGLVTICHHGYCASKASLSHVAQGLHSLGSAVLLVDFYGSGGSSGTGTTVGMREAHDVRAAFDYARERFPDSKLVLYGQSMGGAAILRAVAELGVRPAAIVIESTFDRFSSTVSARFERMGLPTTPFAQLLVFWGSVRCGANAFRHEPVRYAKAVECPLLVLQGAEDPNVSAEQARSIAEAAAGTSRFELIPKVGHGDLISAARGRWFDGLRPFLEGVLAGERRGNP